MNALNELNAAMDAILDNTLPEKRMVVRAYLRVVVMAVKMIQTDHVSKTVDRVVTGSERK